MAIVNCIECGHSVSDKASQCPHCGGSPHGTRCRLCGKAAKTRGMVLRRNAQYHADCLAEVMRAALDGTSCPECGTTLSTVMKADDLLSYEHEIGGFFLSLLDKRITKAALEGREKEELEAIENLSTQESLVRRPACPSCGFPDVLSLKGVCKKCLLPVFGRSRDVTVLESHVYHRRCAG